MLGSVEHEPDPGQNLQLTIDKNIQFMAETALDHAMEKTHADNGTIVVQDVHTGQILALAIRPTFNPNDFRHTTPKLLKDHAVSDVYEPGSVFKLVTYSSALDSNLAKPDELIDCQGGKITLAGRVIHDNQGEHLGVVPLHEALEQSSDVAAVKLSLRVGPDRFYQYIRNFGFGSRTGMELPGGNARLAPSSRVNGTVPRSALSPSVRKSASRHCSSSRWSLLSPTAAPYLPPRILIPNQVNSGTAPDQKAAPPQVPLAAAPFRPSEELPNPLPPGAHRVISEMAAAQMRKMMEGVVLYGSGKPAELNGFSAGGKTGTAQKRSTPSRTFIFEDDAHRRRFRGHRAGQQSRHRGRCRHRQPPEQPVLLRHGCLRTRLRGVLRSRFFEYLGVPHDVEVQQPKVPMKKDQKVEVAEDDSGADQDNVNALFAAVNDLPADDPLRHAPHAGQRPGVRAGACRRRATRIDCGTRCSVNHRIADRSQIRTENSIASHHQRRQKVDCSDAHWHAHAPGD